MATKTGKSRRNKRQKRKQKQKISTKRE